jgi:hypothetical protein
MLVRVLLCTLYTTCFGPDRWPSSGDLQHKIYLKTITNISTDPLSQIYKRAKAVVTVSLKHIRYNSVSQDHRYITDTNINAPTAITIRCNKIETLFPQF